MVSPLVTKDRGAPVGVAVIVSAVLLQRFPEPGTVVTGQYSSLALAASIWHAVQVGSKPAKVHEGGAGNEAVVLFTSKLLALEYELQSRSQSLGLTEHVGEGPRYLVGEVDWV